VQGVLRGLTFSDHLEGGALQAAKQGGGPYSLLEWDS